MKETFSGASSFEGKGLENWDVSGVRDFTSTFQDAGKLNVNLDAWDVSGANYFAHMFDGAWL